MKKVVLAMCIISLLFIGTALAKNPPKHVDTKVFLTEKAPNDGLWTPAPGGFGYLTYSVFGPEFKFKFNAFNLVPLTDYVLAYYPDPWPGIGLVVLAVGTANKAGNLSLKGSVATGTLPIAADENFPGAKVWLVPAQFVGDEKLIGWPDNAAGILFETALINYYPTP